MKSIGGKLYGIIGVSLAALLVATAVACYTSMSTRHGYEDLIETDIAQMSAADSAENELGLAVQAYKNYLLRKDEKYVEEFRRANGAIEGHLKAYQKTAEGEEQKAAVKAAFAAQEKYRDSIQPLVEARSASDDIAAVDKSLKGADNELREQLKKLDELSAAHAKETRQEMHSLSQNLLFLQIGIAFLAALLVAAVSFLIVRGITKAVKNVGTVIDWVAGGDLSAKVRITTNDELGTMGQNFNRMLDTLNGMMSSIIEMASQVAASASQLNSTAEQMATQTEEVASQVGTVATAGEEMAATSGEIAQNCTMAAEGAHRANDFAQSGSSIVQETVEGMSRIAGCVKASADTVENLGARSDQIGAIIGTIEDIADQTNLLALNAAIEAARAGEQGRGFAVVADEVRALAERTTKATREIGEMIKAIQGETKNAVAAMGEGVLEVEKGTAGAAQSGNALDDILAQINEVVSQVSQIATAAEQQTSTTTEISGNIQQITEVIYQTAKGAQESAAAASQLNSIAEELRRLTGKFKLAA
ncbi:methyl-accepting chemotaxis protein [Geobacter sp. DSM 9736]|uniref:methyl-accepting chemotaxis protein n=1 Tax=Geobacter sp. DSM 9736 TaxID=1277350 RepID=UPI000B50C894|nr:methyl-accepting chemotaxis protein [Geobacter sp. DSM 9736]SNB46529.1 methyl-accepting chemotaxis protein [Geobacter sp. DSM 9736]